MYDQNWYMLEDLKYLSVESCCKLWADFIPDSGFMLVVYQHLLLFEDLLNHVSVLRNPVEWGFKTPKYFFEWDCSTTQWSHYILYNK